MKRSLLIAALSTVAAGSALAQSSVTVYGRLNTSVENQEINDLGDKTVLQNNGSRLGFRGLEDLGGGLKAGFTLEHRFNSDNGQSTNGTAFWGGAGESSVYLLGGFGMIKAGLYTSEAYFATSDSTDLLNHGTGTSSDALYVGLNGPGNKVSYRTPTFGGAWIEGAVMAGEGNVATPHRGYDLAANWTMGAFGIGAGYEKSQFDESQQYALRGSWSASPFTVTGYVQRYENEPLDTNKTIWRVSGQYDIGAIELHAAYGMASEFDAAGTANDLGEGYQYTFGANYNLSKRTKLFAFYNRNGYDSMPGVAESKFTALSAGIRHNF